MPNVAPLPPQSNEGAWEAFKCNVKSFFQSDDSVVDDLFTNVIENAKVSDAEKLGCVSGLRENLKVRVWKKIDEEPHKPEGIRAVVVEKLKTGLPDEKVVVASLMNGIARKLNVEVETPAFVPELEGLVKEQLDKLPNLDQSVKNKLRIGFLGDVARALRVEDLTYMERKKIESCEFTPQEAEQVQASLNTVQDEKAFVMNLAQAIGKTFPPPLSQGIWKKLGIYLPRMLGQRLGVELLETEKRKYKMTPANIEIEMTANLIGNGYPPAAIQVFKNVYAWFEDDAGSVGPVGPLLERLEHHLSQISPAALNRAIQTNSNLKMERLISLADDLREVFALVLKTAEDQECRSFYDVHREDFERRPKIYEEEEDHLSPAEQVWTPLSLAVRGFLLSFLTPTALKWLKSLPGNVEVQEGAEVDKDTFKVFEDFTANKKPVSSREQAMDQKPKPEQGTAESTKK